MSIRHIFLFPILILSLSGCTEKATPEPEERGEKDCLFIDLDGIDFSSDRVFEAFSDEGRLALITKEYLGEAIEKQAVLVYPLRADGRWNTDSIAVPTVTLIRNGSGFSVPVEAVSGGSLKYYETDNTYYYNDVSEACELPARKLFIKRNPDGSTSVLKKSTTLTAARMKPVTMALDGHDYPLVKIAGQLWTAENIKASRNSDGTPVPNASSWTSYVPNWRVSPNPRAGILYSAAALGFSETAPDRTDIISGMAPDGWRLPSGGSLGDWAEVCSFAGDASSVLDSGHNVTGLSIVPSGRVHTNGETWDPSDDDCLFWSSTYDTDRKVFFMKVYTKTEGNALRCTSSTNMRSGFAVRLTKDFNDYNR